MATKKPLDGHPILGSCPEGLGLRVVVWMGVDAIFLEMKVNYLKFLNSD